MDRHLRQRWLGPLHRIETAYKHVAPVYHRPVKSASRGTRPRQVFGHSPGGQRTDAGGRHAPRKIDKAHLTADAYWIGSMYAPEAGALYCTWDAQDADAIRKVLAKAAPDLPTEGPYLITMNIRSEDLR